MTAPIRTRRKSTFRWWTYPEIAALERMCEAGLSTAEIAARLHRTPASIKGQSHLRGIFRGCPTRRERWVALLCSPHRIAAVAAAMGVTAETVQKAKTRLRTAGLIVPPAEKGRAA